MTIGLLLEGSRAFVDRNELRGGCGRYATGLKSVDSGARVQNNHMLAFTDFCAGHYPSGSNVYGGSGTDLQLAVSSPEIDLHSNFTAYWEGASIGISGGPALSFTRTAAAPAGILRNNTIYPTCQSCTGASPPRVFEGNEICLDSDDCTYASLLKDSGVTTGAPLWDFDGRFRDDAPDIGPREF